MVNWRVVSNVAMYTAIAAYTAAFWCAVVWVVLTMGT
jgi:hypothetical protein